MKTFKKEVLNLRKTKNCTGGKTNAIKKKVTEYKRTQ